MRKEDDWFDAPFATIQCRVHPSLTDSFLLLSLKYPGSTSPIFVYTPRAQSPALASGHCVCRLLFLRDESAERILIFELRTGKMWEADDGIGGVHTNTDDIDQLIGLEPRTTGSSSRGKASAGEVMGKNQKTE